MPASGLLGGRYRLEEPPIGKGGMGIVYRAVDLGVGNRKVAVKTISGPVDGASLEQFRKEWDVLAGLCHANIVNIYDVGEFAGSNGKKPYFVMPLLRGSDLGGLLQPPGSRVDSERLVGIVAQVCKGLQSAHNRGIVHRDLKPSNIFLLEDDTVILIDFGLVHLVSNNSAIGIKGTLPYMSPEQLDGKATPQSDIFSLAVVCYEALTGRRPFSGETPPQLMDSIRSAIPPLISDLNPSVPFSLAQVIHRALAKKPYHRLASAKEFAHYLQGALNGEPIPPFDRARVEPRLNRIKKALNQGDSQYARELIRDLEAEGHIDPEISILRVQIEEASRNRLIQQLLDSARLRMDEQDYPLAEENIQSVLDLDPTNIDALALRREIKDKRSSAGVERWYQIACQHRDRKLFTKAREAIAEILRIDPYHGPATELLAEVKRGEQEEGRLQEEMQRLYQAARKAYGSGEFSTALSKLERILELSKRVSGHTQTNGEYERLYNQVRLESDQLQTAYGEARAALESRDLTKVRNISKQVLERRPGDALFKALLIEVDTLERQIRSASIADLHSQIQAEPDLEAKFELVKRAVGLFEDEPTFAEAFRLIKQKRDLVNTIAMRAREYESQSQFVEARNQWQILKNIYSQYPGLNYEVNRLEQKLQDTWREQTKSEVLQRTPAASSEAADRLSIPPIGTAKEPPPEYRELEDGDGRSDSGLSESGESGTEISHGFSLSELSESGSPIRLGDNLSSAPRGREDIFAGSVSDSRHQSTSCYAQAENISLLSGSELAPSIGSRNEYRVAVDLERDEPIRLKRRTIIMVGVAALVVLLVVIFASMTRFQKAPESYPKPEPHRESSSRPVADADPSPGNTFPGSQTRNDEVNRKADLGILSPQPPLPSQQLSEVHLRSDPEHAQVRADRKIGLECETPCSLKLGTGNHVLSFTAPNRESVSRLVKSPTSDEVVVELPYATAPVKVISDPLGMDLSIDGNYKGKTPIELRLTVGPHRLKVVRNGVLHEETIEVGHEEEGLKIFTIDLTGSTGPPAGG